MNAGAELAPSLERPLAGRHVVVTRPAGQMDHLAEALVSLGAKPVLFPVLAIADLADVTPVIEMATHLDQYDLAVFVSPNAIQKSLALILPRRPWPMGLRVATIGKSSERELARHGIAEVIAPVGRFDSEALLELSELQNMAGKRVLIFRGDGGRELLGDTLAERGARVDYLTCYRRTRPTQAPTHLLDLWQDGRLDAMTITSSEGLRNLFDMVGKLGQTFLKKTPLFVPHQRIADQAVALGCHEIIATGPGDDGLLAGLVGYFVSNHEH